jgi:hypothetical protein
MDAYLASLSDEEALVLARRREQDLLMLQTKLGRPLLPPQLARAPVAPRAHATTQKGLEPVSQLKEDEKSSLVRSPQIPVARPDGRSMEDSTYNLTDEEKQLLARHRAQKLSSLAQAEALAAERTQWAKMKAQLNDRQDSVSPAAASLPPPAALSPPVAFLPNNVAQRDSVPAAAMLARQAQGVASLPNNVARRDPMSDVEAAFLARARRLQQGGPLPNNSQGRTLSEADYAFLERARHAKGLPSNFPAQLEAASLERARQAQAQADFLATARQNLSAMSGLPDLESIVLARARQAQMQNDTDAPPSQQGQPKRDSISVVKAALEAKRRAGMLNSVSLPAASQNPLFQNIGQSQSAQFRGDPRLGIGNLSQTNPRLNESRTNVDAIRESLLRGDIDVAKLFAMNKGPRL